VFQKLCKLGCLEAFWIVWSGVRNSVVIAGRWPFACLPFFLLAGHTFVFVGFGVSEESYGGYLFYVLHALTGVFVLLWAALYVVARASRRRQLQTLAALLLLVVVANHMAASRMRQAAIVGASTFYDGLNERRLPMELNVGANSSQVLSRVAFAKMLIRIVIELVSLLLLLLLILCCSVLMVGCDN
jgi:hypothetical protein